MLALQDVLSLASGSLVGLILGLIGGGGSILAVPLLVYVVGVPSAHVAIGTSAIAVAASAAINLSGHARAGTVRWPCAIVFALCGIAGAAIGAQLGKMVDGEKLLTLFGALWFGSLGTGAWWLVFGLVAALREWPPGGEPPTGPRARVARPPVGLQLLRMLRTLVAGGILAWRLGAGSG